MNKTKRWLRSAWVLTKQVEANLDEVAVLRSLLCKVTPVYSGLPSGSCGGDRTADVVAKVLDLEGDIRRDTERLVRRVEEIRAAIEAVDDERCRLVLTMRYLTYMKWDDIACRMNYSVKQVFRFHARGLRAVWQVRCQ